MNDIARIIRKNKLSELAGILAPVIFVLVFTVEGFLRPGYNALSTYVSALSLGPRGWIQILNFVILGILMMAFTYGVRIQFNTGKASKAGPLLLIASAICFLVSGPFVMDPMGTLLANSTIHGTVHGIAGAIVFILMPVTCFVFFRRFRSDTKWDTMKWWSFIAGMFISLAVVFFSVVSKSQALGKPFIEWFGLIQRSIIIPYMVWLSTFAVSMFRKAPNI
jgi:hypothetical protein